MIDREKEFDNKNKSQALYCIGAMNMFGLVFSNMSFVLLSSNI
jgi:hypothetical protein